MKKTVLLMVAMILFAGAASAADIFDFDSPKQGKVSFHHKVHQMLLKDCKKCHEHKPGKIGGFGKEWAHNTCKTCHIKMKKGPTTCKGCHKK